MKHGMIDSLSPRYVRKRWYESMNEMYDMYEDTCFSVFGWLLILCIIFWFEEIFPCSISFPFEFLIGDESESSRIHTVSFSSEVFWSIIEYVSEMWVSIFWTNFYTSWKKRCIFTERDIFRIETSSKTRPTRSRIEFIKRRKKRRPIDNIDIYTLSVIIPIWIIEWWLSTTLLCHMIREWR